MIATRTDYWDDLSGIDRIEFEGYGCHVFFIYIAISCCRIFYYAAAVKKFTCIKGRIELYCYASLHFSRNFSLFGNISFCLFLFADIAYNIGRAVLKWMYTDHIDCLLGNRCLMEIFTAAVKYRFLDLQIRLFWRNFEVFISVSVVQQRVDN